MSERFSRTEIMLGKESVSRLKSATVAVFGVGGVGGAAAEALARGGVGHLVLVDADTVSASNINRQMVALSSNVGMAKVQAAKMRLEDINPNIKVDAIECFFDASTKDRFNFSSFDYVIDAIDTVSSKIEIAKMAKSVGCGIISAMGAGNKLDPTKFMVSDIFKTKVCPLARALRGRLKKEGIESLKCVYSEEEPTLPKGEAVFSENGHPLPGSVSFVPPVMGYILAGEAIKDLIK